MTWRIETRLCRVVAAVVWLAPAVATAQTAPVTQPADATRTPTSAAWLVIGGAQTTLRGDCTFCEEEGIEARYSNTGSLLVNLGRRVNSRMDAGLEVAWLPASSRDGDPIRMTFLVGVAQFRPWESRGFFVKGGMGMAFTRNFLFTDESPITQKALAVVIGGGWAFRPAERVGFQLYGAQHVAALGDFELRQGTFENVMANVWTLGAAVVIR